MIQFNIILLFITSNWLFQKSFCTKLLFALFVYTSWENIHPVVASQFQHSDSARCPVEIKRLLITYFLIVHFIPGGFKYITDISFQVLVIN